MKGFNLSAWALEHRNLVLYMMVTLGIVGALAYGRLGQSEDPPFTFKIMVIRTNWPGATAHEVEQQITDKIERKLQEAPNVDYLRSYSQPGQSLVFFVAKDSTAPRDMPATFYQVRKKVGDIRHTLPAGIQGPFFDDEFGDIYGNIYALTGDGSSYAQLKDHADRIRRELLRVPDVAKVDYFGEQEQKIYVEVSNVKLATLGLDLASVVAALAQQNAIAPAGAFDTATDRVFVRASGEYETVEQIRDTSIRAAGRVLRIGDIGRVYRGYVDPPVSKMRYLGHEALGVGVAMVKGGDIIELGRDLDREVTRIQAGLPVGLDLHKVSDQPQAVQRSVREFVRTLAEAVVW